jgi:hypothetical protein
MTSLSRKLASLPGDAAAAVLRRADQSTITAAADRLRGAEHVCAPRRPRTCTTRRDPAAVAAAGRGLPGTTQYRNEDAEGDNTFS